MNEYQRYFFDVNGYLVIPEAMDTELLAAANRAIDRYQDEIRPRPREQTLAGGHAQLQGDKGRLELPRRLLELEPPWCDPFLEMLDHPRLVPCLEAMLGPGFRLDHTPMFLGMVQGCEGFTLHNGGTPHDPAQFYAVHGTQMFNGLVTASWQLTSTGPGDGGFCCIPGSHKAGFPCPDKLHSGKARDELLVQPAVAAGSLLLFTEALTHGTLPWNSPHQRRSILYKYSPGHMAFAPVTNFPEALLERLGENRRGILAPPCRVSRRPLCYD